MFRTFLSIIPLLPVYPGAPISQRWSSTKQQQHGGWPTWLHKIFFAKAFYKNTDIIILPK